MLFPGACVNASPRSNRLQYELHWSLLHRINIMCRCAHWVCFYKTKTLFCLAHSQWELSFTTRAMVVKGTYRLLNGLVGMNDLAQLTWMEQSPGLILTQNMATRALLYALVLCWKFIEWLLPSRSEICVPLQPNGLLTTGQITKWYFTKFTS